MARLNFERIFTFYIFFTLILHSFFVLHYLFLYGLLVAEDFRDLEEMLMARLNF